MDYMKKFKSFFNTNKQNKKVPFPTKEDLIEMIEKSDVYFTTYVSQNLRYNNRTDKFHLIYQGRVSNGYSYFDLETLSKERGAILSTQ